REQGAEEALAGGTDQHREPELVERPESGDHLPVLLGGLGEAQAGVEHDLLVAYAGCARRLEALGELAAYAVDDAALVGGEGVGLHVVGVGTPVHGDVDGAGLGDHVEDPRVGQSTADVVDDPGPGGDSGDGDLGAHRVDGEA